jgi:thiaminase
MSNELSTRDRAIAQRLVENDFAPKGERKTLEELAQELSMTRQNLHRIRSNPEFVRYQDSISYTALAQHMPEIDAMLLKLVRGTSNNGIGSIKAIELAYKVTNRLSNDTTVYHADASDKPKMSRAELTSAIDDLNRTLQ